MRKQNGIAAIATTLIVLALVTIITLTTAHVIAIDERIYRNVFNTEQAKNAAHAGFDYALGYLNKNLYLNVTDGKVFNATLPNNAAYNVVYTFVTAGTDTDLIQIKSTGTSADGGSTRFVQALIKPYYLAPIVDLPVTAAGGVTADSTGTVVYNNTNNNNLVMGGVLNMVTGASTNVGGTKTTWGSIVGGVPGNGADKGFIGTDVTQNVSALSGMSATELQSKYLGQQVTDFVNSANSIRTYTGNFGNIVSFNPNSIGPVVYVNMTGTPSPTLTLSLPSVSGSPTNPVTLIINFANTGSVVISGSMTPTTPKYFYGNIITNGALRFSYAFQINGFVFSLKDTWLQNFFSDGLTRVEGGVVAGTNVILGVTNGYPTQIGYDQTNLKNSVPRKYGIISGSWKDF